MTVGGVKWGDSRDFYGGCNERDNQFGQTCYGRKNTADPHYSPREPREEQSRNRISIRSRFARAPEAVGKFLTLAYL